jgi:cytochrome c oxidase subunit II
MTPVIASTFAAMFGEPPKFPPSDSFWMPKEASTFAPNTDWLFMALYWISVVSAVLIFAVMAYFVVKYRSKGRTSKERPVKTSTHNTTLEISWSIGPLIVVVAVFVYGFRGFMDLRSPPKGAIEIQVTGQKWNWTFTYPNGSSDNVLHVPVNTPVRLVLTSVDVIHSVWIPVFRTKMDAVPGRYTDLWFNATQTGDFPLECTEYCGTGHSDMLTHVIVHPQGEEWQPASLDNLPPEELGKALYEKKGCSACHTIDGTKKVGPSFKGLWAKGKEQTNTGVVDINEDYIKESLMEPQAKIVNGFAPAMPTFKGQLKDSEIAGIIAFLKSLK